MNELVVIVEGETEQTFVHDQLAEHLALHNTSIWAVLPGRHRNRGGVKKWEVAREDIIRTLKERRYCSTMFDYYAMPTDWPGRSAAVEKQWSQRASHVEDMIHSDVSAAMGSKFNPKYFIPYVQLHEFEALAFADVEVLASVLSPIGTYSSATLIEKFNEILNEAGAPEAIDDGYETCPSRRIAMIVPAYKKRAQGPIITQRIGIDLLRTRCTHFGDWLRRLEQLDMGNT
ncbi:MAG: DUF4276 family protein [Planctomycetaceae bacterium]